LSTKQPDKRRVRRSHTYDEVDQRNGRDSRSLTGWYTLNRRLSLARTWLVPGSRPATVGTRKGSTSCWPVEKASVTDSPERDRTRSNCDVRCGEHRRAGVPRQKNGNRCVTSQYFHWRPALRFSWHRTRVAEDLSRGLRFRDYRGCERSDQNGHSRYCEPTHCARSGGPSAARRLRFHRRSAKRTDRIGPGDRRGKAWQPHPRRH
jgi:hypothetical protein